ncbi:MAG: undecaprenyl-diphosphate phosphatase [Candidatus Nezhaarchaeales archaeon]
MEVLLLIILGVIQGVAEWIPVSSQGIISLILLHFGISPNEAVNLAIWLHAGTLLAAVLYFRKDLKRLVNNLLPTLRGDINDDSKFLMFIVIATVITCVVGFFVYQVVSWLAGTNLTVFMVLIGVCLILIGLIQKLAMKERTFRRLKIPDSILIGLIQAFSIMPGLSRSGLTIATMLFLGYSAKDSVRISFILSIPVIAMAEAYLLLTNKAYLLIPSAAIGVLVSAVVGYATIGTLMNVASKLKSWLFCILIGCLSLIPMIIT